MNLLIWAVISLFVQPSAGTSSGVDEALRERLPYIEQNLGSLRPDVPEGYLVLAEEIAQQATRAEHDELAERLFVLAFEHARRRGGPGDPALMATAAIALGDLAPGERDRRWLGSIARALDSRYGSPDWARVSAGAVSSAAAFDAAEAIGFLRAGEGVRARRLLNNDEVREVLRRYSAVLGGAGATEIMTRLDALARAWPCPECSNDRVVSVRTDEGSRTEICPTCRTDPGWRLDGRGLVATLRFESIVLSGEQRSWSAQHVVDGGEPLRDPDPRQLASQFGVNPDYAYFRDGRWVDAP